MLDAPAPAASIAGVWITEPQGVILHGSRSGLAIPVFQEFLGTSSWARQGAPFHNSDGSVDFLGWNATIGEHEVANHIDCGHWGWSARKFSHMYLAVEFAQSHENDPISDAAVTAFAWWFLNVARARWPTLPAVFPTHAELDRTLASPDGKTDCFIDGGPIRARIMALLG